MFDPRAAFDIQPPRRSLGSLGKWDEKKTLNMFIILSCSYTGKTICVAFAFSSLPLKPPLLKRRRCSFPSTSAELFWVSDDIHFTSRSLRLFGKIVLSLLMLIRSSVLLVPFYRHVLSCIFICCVIGMYQEGIKYTFTLKRVRIW